MTNMETELQSIMNKLDIMNRKHLPSKESDTYFIKSQSNEIMSLSGIPYFVWLGKTLIYPNMDVPLMSLYLENDEADVFSCRFYITLEENPRVFLSPREMEAPKEELSHLVDIVKDNKCRWVNMALSDPIYILMPEWYENDLIEVI